MPSYTFTLNGKKTTVEAPADLSVLWTLRDKLGVTGPKYGCGINVCKACTSHIDGTTPFNPCVTNVSEIDGRKITTIEGLAKKGRLHPVQRAWLAQDVAQCGFCQPGQIMSAVALLERTRNPTDAEIDEIDNVCRCGTYFRIREAIKLAARLMDEEEAAATTDGDAAPAVAPLASDPTGPLAAAAGTLPTTGVSTAAGAVGAVVAAGAVAARLAQQGDAAPA